MKQPTYCFETLEVNMHKVYDLIKTIADSESTVLITGGSGTGKDAISRLIHDQSIRRDNTYTAINCAAIPETLIETELFGYEAGAFTGAEGKQTGKFETASGGTVVLDEISEINLKTQAKLLRVLESREFYRVGGNEKVKLDVRIIITTNKNLKECIKNGTFREDLYHRLDVMRLEVPNLNERNKDIPLLVDFFVNELIRENERELTISPEVYHFLCQRRWEGNVRELKNFVTRMYYLAKNTSLTIQDLYQENLGIKQPVTQFTVPTADNLSLYEMEKRFILHTMTQVSGNKSKAARSLKISLKTLRNKLKEYDYSQSTVPFLPNNKPDYRLGGNMASLK